MFLMELTKDLFEDDSPVDAEHSIPFNELDTSELDNTLHNRLNAVFPVNASQTVSKAIG